MAIYGKSCIWILLQWNLNKCHYIKKRKPLYCLAVQRLFACRRQGILKKDGSAHRGTANSMRPQYRRTIIMKLPVKIKRYLLIASLAAVTSFTASAQRSGSSVGRQAIPLPVIKTDSLVTPWQWRQYLQTVSDSTNGRSTIYEAYPSHNPHSVTNNWEATPPFRWNDIASITAIALLGYFMSR